MAELGIGEDRMRLEDRMPRDRFWALYGDIDIMLVSRGWVIGLPRTTQVSLCM